MQHRFPRDAGLLVGFARRYSSRATHSRYARVPRRVRVAPQRPPSLSAGFHKIVGGCECRVLHTTRLSDDDQARHYAKLLIRELKDRADHRDLGLRLIVRNDHGDLIHDIPF